MYWDNTEIALTCYVLRQLNEMHMQEWKNLSLSWNGIPFNGDQYQIYKHATING